jgi:hypothetical protein
VVCDAYLHACMIGRRLENQCRGEEKGKEESGVRRWSATMKRFGSWSSCGFMPPAVHTPKDGDR